MNEMLQQFFHVDNFIPTAELLPMVGSLLLNSVVVWVLVHFFYYPKGHRRDYYFTFVLLSVSIFMLIYLLLGNSADMGIGAALGLFAIFGIIRYRTECVPIREMTYLFFIVALSVLNAKTGDLNFMSRIIINLIQPERYEELKADLEKRLGVKITRVDVGAVDFLTDMTMLRVFYEDPDHRIKAVDRLTKIPTDNAF